MKKLFTLVAMALMAVGASAQTLVAERDWTGVAEYDLGFFQEGESDATYAMVADGIAITHSADMGEGKEWMPQMSVLQDFNLAIDETYKVVVTAKIPADGFLQINMGSWGVNKQYVVPVTAGDDFQEIEVEFPDWADDAEGCHVLFQPGRIVGTTIIKKVEVYNMSGEAPEPAGEEVIAERDWTGVAEYDLGFFQEGESDATYAMVADGIAITHSADMGEGKEWMPQMSVLQDFNLAIDETYKVVVTAKIPADGFLQINMGSWGVNKQYVVPVTAGDDFQEIEVEFPDWADDAEGCHVLFQPGRIVGTTIIKKVQVIHEGATAIKTVKAVKEDGAIYNLAGQRVSASYKGVVIQNGKKYIQK